MIYCSYKTIIKNNNNNQSKSVGLVGVNQTGLALGLSHLGHCLRSPY